MNSFFFGVMALLLVGTSIHCQDKPDTSRQFILSAAKEIMTSAKTCALITQDENGVPQVRTMEPFTPQDDLIVWLATNPNSRKVKQMERNKNVVVYYSDKDDNGYVTIHGSAELISDQKEKDKRWKDQWDKYYPNRTSDYLLIKIIPRYLEVINYKRGILGDRKTWQPSRVDFK